MSVDTVIFLRHEKLPTRDEWQAALDTEQTGIVLSDVDDLRKFSGYLPVRYHGEESGFEWYCDAAADALTDPPEGAEEFDLAANFVTHSDMRELICASLASAILAKLTDGRFYDEEANKLVTWDLAMEEARQIEESERG